MRVSLVEREKSRDSKMGAGGGLVGVSVRGGEVWLMEEELTSSAMTSLGCDFMFVGENSGREVFSL